MKLILHAGHNKCGSSTIQKFLKENLSQLKALKVGVVNQNMKISNPDELNCHLPNEDLHNILFITQNTSNLKSALVSLKKEADRKNLDSIILTHERFSGPQCFNGKNDILKIINSVFSHVEVIYYIRRQDEYSLSAWQQWGIKEGQSYEQYLLSTFKVKLDFKLCIEGFRNIFGSESLKLGFLHKATLFKGNLLTDFIFKLGLKSEEFNLVSDDNIGIQAGYSDLLRRTPNIFNSRSDNRIREFLIKNITHSSEIIYSKEKPAIFYFYSKKIMELFEDDNREIHKSYFLDYDFNLLFNKNKYELKSNTEIFKIEIEQLKNLIVIQNDLIFTLINRFDKKSNFLNKRLLFQKIKSFFFRNTRINKK